MVPSWRHQGHPWMGDERFLPPYSLSSLSPPPMPDGLNPMTHMSEVAQEGKSLA